jgi:hypothetical protein
VSAANRGPAAAIFCTATLWPWPRWPRA